MAANQPISSADRIAELNEKCSQLLLGGTLKFGSMRNELTIPQWTVIQRLNTLEDIDVATAALAPYRNDPIGTAMITLPLDTNRIAQHAYLGLPREDPLTLIFIPGMWVVSVLDAIEASIKTQTEWIAGYVALVGVFECHCQWMTHKGQQYYVVDNDLVYDPGFVAKLKYAIERVVALARDSGPDPERLFEIQKRIMPCLMTSITMYRKEQIQLSEIERVLQSMNFRMPMGSVDPRALNDTVVSEGKAQEGGGVIMDPDEPAKYTQQDSRVALDARLGVGAADFFMALMRAAIASILVSFAGKTMNGATTTLNHTMLPMGSTKAITAVRGVFADESAEVLQVRKALGHVVVPKSQYKPGSALIAAMAQKAEPRVAALDAIRDALSPQLLQFVEWGFDTSKAPTLVVAFQRLMPNYTFIKPGDPMFIMQIFKPDMSVGSTAFSDGGGGRHRGMNHTSLNPHQEAEFHFVMSEFSRGALTSHGKVVENRDMAEAIAFAESRHHSSMGAGGRDDDDSGLTARQERVYARAMGRYANGTMMGANGHAVVDMKEAEEQAYGEAVAGRDIMPWAMGAGGRECSTRLRHVRPSVMMQRRKLLRKEKGVPKNAMGAGGRGDDEDGKRSMPVKKPKAVPRKGTHAVEFRRGQWHRKLGT